MLSIFTIPKSFSSSPHTAVIQRNAITSWVRALGDRGEVLLLGDDPGVAETAREMGVRHLPGTPTTDLGTPFLSDAFERVRAEARFDLLCWANADIVFLPDLLPVVERIPFSDFLAVGERWNLDVEEPVDFGDAHWDEQLRRRALTQGKRNHVYGMDYFVFFRHVPLRMPRFVVGRVRWDHWMIHQALERRLPVVDLSQGLLAVHQNHGYEHIPQGTGDQWEGPESQYNRTLYRDIYSLCDATHEMQEDRSIRRSLSDRALYYRVLNARRRERNPVVFFVLRVLGVFVRWGVRYAPRAQWWRWPVYLATRTGRFGLR